MFFVASRKHLSSQKHLCFIYLIYLSCLSCTTTRFLAQQVGDICFGATSYTCTTCEALAQYVILNLVTAVICDNSMRIVSVRDPGKSHVEPGIY